MNKAQSFALRSLGDIAVSLPGSTAIFRRHKLDFCCGGSESLERAALKKGLDLTPIEAELACLSPEQSSIPESVEDLIGYIFERYHPQVHRREMPELRNLASSRRGGACRSSRGACGPFRSVRAHASRTRISHAEGRTSAISAHARRRQSNDRASYRHDASRARRAWRAARPSPL